MPKESAWISLVKEQQKKNPKKTFKEVLKICSAIYRKTKKTTGFLKKSLQKKGRLKET